MARAATIFALSSAAGRAGVAVVRVSGPAAADCLRAMIAGGPKPRPRVASGRRVVDPATGGLIDRGIVLWFPAPKSFTGEDVVELQLHGGRAVVRAVLAGLGKMTGYRAAEAGEFARRAFDNGKIDLAEAEGLADLIDAETEAQRRQAVAQAGGMLSGLYDGWRSSILEAQALVEAAIDFADEPDVESDTVARARSIVATLAVAIRRHLDDGHRGEILRQGFKVALTGAPNVGKSSLLNALARREAAIVSPEAGTTRDVIVVSLDIEGLPIVLSDTAGLRETDSAVEQEGIARTVRAVEEAQLVLWVTDVSNPEADLAPELMPFAEKILPVMNKADTLAGGIPREVPDDGIAISARTGAGLADLTRRIGAIARERLGDGGEEPVITQARHRAHLEAAARSLADYLDGPPFAIELRAEDLRLAATEIGRITGRIDVEDILDHVFKRFCIGK